MTTTRNLAERQVRPIGLGCMNLSWAYGAPPPRDEAIRLLNRALDLGYNHLDTARIYGAGHNESLLAEAVGHRRGEYLLASKMGIVVDGDKRWVDCSPARIRSEVEVSLSLLKTDRIDLYYLHRRDFNVPIEESVGELARLVAEGKIGAIGLSEMSAETLRRAHAVHPIAAMQTEYSPWTRNVEIAILEATRELGVTLVAFSPVGRGALAGGVTDPAALDPKDLRRSMPRFNAENWPHNHSLIAQYEALAAAAGVTPAQLSLGWVLSRGDHVVAIPGTTSLAHLEENFARDDWRPDAALADQVDALINQQSIAGHRYHDAIRPTIDTEDFG